MTTTGTTLGATRSITGTTSIEVEARAVDLTATAVERVTAPTQGTGLPTGTSAGAAKLTTVPVHPPGLSTEMPGLLEDTLNPVARAASAPVPSAAMTMADKKEAFRNAEAPASVAAEGFTAVVVEGLTGAVAGIGNRSFVTFLVDREI